VLRAAALVAAESLVVVIGWAIWTTAVRPYFGEGEAIFEASRIRSGMNLYIDGVVGTHDYGEPPTHYFVLYTPLWPALLSLLPAAKALALGRAIATALWLGILGLFVAMAPGGERRAPALAAVYFAGTYNLAIFATSARHDMLAVTLAGLALAQAMHRERVDVLSGALFALAAWVKPNVLGLAVGAFLVQPLVAPGAMVGALSGAAVVSGICAAALHYVSHGTWFDHLVSSTAQPLTLGNWLASVQKDLLWFGMPVAVAAGAGLATRRPAARIALAALVTSTAWAIFLGAKTGRGSNYWLEPSVAAVAVLAAAPWPRERRWALALAAAVALFQALWVGIASNRSVQDALERAEAHNLMVVAARTGCLARGGLVLSNDTGDELDLDGRILTPSYQFSHLVLAGKAPASLLVEELEHPRARCYLEHSASEVRTVPEAAAALERDYELQAEASEWRLLVRRPPPAPKRR
jgi:hypothetical protein